MKYSDSDYEALIKVSPEAPIIKMIGQLGITENTGKVHTLTSQVMKACNVIRPKLENLRQNPRKSLDAKNFQKMLKTIQVNSNIDVGNDFIKLHQASE
jgi:hypothetical protein